MLPSFPFSPLTFSICHAVKKQPVCVERPVLDETHVVTCLYACHSKERHCSAGAVQRPGPWTIRNTHFYWAVGHPFPVTVDLKKLLK